MSMRAMVNRVVLAIALCGAAGVVVQIRAADSARAAADGASAVPLGPHGGPIIQADPYRLEVLARDTSFTVYLYDARMAAVDPSRTSARLTVSSGHLRAYVDLRRVGNHLQGTAGTRLPRDFTADIALQVASERLSVHLPREVVQAALAAPDSILGPDMPFDLKPRHGGEVFDSGDYSFEVALDRAGRHRVWVADEFKGWRPPEGFAGHVLVVRQDGTQEDLVLAADGECLAATGRPVAGAATASLQLDLEGTATYSGELNFAE